MGVTEGNWKTKKFLGSWKCFVYSTQVCSIWEKVSVVELLSIYSFLNLNVRYEEYVFS